MELLNVTFLWSSYFLMSLSVWTSDDALDATFGINGLVIGNPN